jgi:hypothetical protein
MGSCGTAAKAGGNREHKLRPAGTEGSPSTVDLAESIEYLQEHGFPDASLIPPDEMTGINLASSMSEQINSNLEAAGAFTLAKTISVMDKQNKKPLFISQPQRRRRT